MSSADRAAGARRSPLPRRDRAGLGRGRATFGPARNTATPIIAATLEILADELGITLKDTRFRARVRFDQLVVLALTTASVTSSLAFGVLRWRFGR